MRPGREGEKDRACDEEQAGVDARPPAELRDAPKPDRGETKKDQAEESGPSENVGCSQPWIEAVANESDVLVRQTQRQENERDKNDLEQANDAAEDVQSAIQSADKELAAVTL